MQFQGYSHILYLSGLVSDFEMLRTFNCGVGMVVIADAAYVPELLDTVEGIAVVGTVEDMGLQGGSSAYDVFLSLRYHRYSIAPH